MGGEKNLATLDAMGIPYLIGMRVRASKVVQALLAQAGSYQRVTDHLEVREVSHRGRRYVICVNDEAASRERGIRERMVAEIEKDLALPRTARRAYGHPHKKRYLRMRDGRIEIDHQKVEAAERLDGLSVILVGDPKLSAEEAALGYRGRWRVEAAFRHLKSFVNLRPVHHRTESRIHAHVTVCMLTYFLERLAELRTGQTFGAIRDELQKLVAATWQDENGTVVQSSRPSAQAHAIFRALGVEPPSQLLRITPASAGTPATV